jgi:signal peptidase
MTLVTETVPTQAPATETGPSAWRYFVGVVSTLVAILLVMVACVAIVLAVATHFSPKGQYTVFGHPVMIVLSGSMSPVIRTGDLIIDNPVTAAQAERLKVGQIVSFREAPGSQTIDTHRIAGIEHSGGTVSYITKGDANNAPDTAPRPSSDVIGVFSTAIPRGGYLLNALHKPLTLLLILVSPVLWFLAGPLYKWAGEMDQPASREPAASAGEAEADEL